jgi:hypothetical protein
LPIIVRLQIDRLSSHWSPQHIELIELDFQDLCSAYEREPSLKQVLDQCNSKTSFEQGWDYVLERFEQPLENVLWRLSNCIPRNILC